VGDAAVLGVAGGAVPPEAPVAVKDDRLRAYNALIDCCDVHMWEVGLAWTPNERWEISVRDKGELLARSSRVDLADAARVCGRALEKSGRLR
jgi:hypothetical protein